MSDRRRSHEDRVANNPVLRGRLESRLDIAENANGRYKTADETEEAAIEQLQRQGNELLHEWATNRQREELSKHKSRSENIVVHEKKLYWQTTLGKNCGLRGRRALFTHPGKAQGALWN